MTTKICPYCYESFAEAHGNRDYCPDKDCGREAKILRSKKQYETISVGANPLWLNEKILRECYKKYGSQREIDPDELETAGFDFDLDSDEMIVNALKIYFMKKFGYSFLKNKNIIVWKL